MLIDGGINAEYFFCFVLFFFCRTASSSKWRCRTTASRSRGVRRRPAARRAASRPATTRRRRPRPTQTRRPLLADGRLADLGDRTAHLHLLSALVSASQSNRLRTPSLSLSLFLLC